MKRRRYARIRAFTLFEALLAITITAVAGSAVLLGISSGIQSTDVAKERAIATGIAAQLIDEIAGARYVDVAGSPSQWPLGPESGETARSDRQLFDDLDDFNGVSESPPADLWGVPLGFDDGQGDLRHPSLRIAGSLLANWQVDVSVYYVSDSDTSVALADGVTSNHRAVQVQVTVNDPGGGTRELANLQRVFAYVPPL